MTGDDPFDTATHLDLNLMQGFPPPPNKRVTRLNGLWVPPFNRWAYQHMRELWPTAAVRPAAEAVPVPKRIDGRIETSQITRPDGTSADFETFLRQTFTDSLVVIKGGAVVYERYLNGMTADTPHIMFSCTKSFVGLLALMAIEEGLVSETTPIVQILPELAGSGFSGATFGQVMDMTTAIRFNEDYADPAAEIHDYAAILGAGTKADGAVEHDLYSYVQTLGAEPGRQHGTVFDYRTPQTDVLNWAVSRLTGRSFIGALEDRIWSQIGTGGEACVMLDPTGIIFAGGGLNATAPDLTRFAVMALAGGQFGGRQVVPASVFDEVAKGGSTEAFERGPSAGINGEPGHWSYRAQWWVRNVPGREAFLALGVNGQMIYVDRTRNVAVVKQSSWPEADTDYFYNYTLSGVDAMIRQIADVR
jgi:CubicO group peptidase (beta-lactamase class C family)